MKEAKKTAIEIIIGIMSTFNISINDLKKDNKLNKECNT